MESAPNDKFVTVIVPCYNEIIYISKFIEDLKSQDYPSHLIDFIIVDGGSNDGTVNELNKVTSDDSRFKILHNQKRTAPFAMNMGIKEATGELIVRMDVHASYPVNYISTLVKKIYSQKNIGNAGAVLITVPANNLPKSRGIALAMASSLGVGGAKFRTGIQKDTLVDTVPFGCFPKKVFTDVGLFNESLTRSQDYEFNTRLKVKGYGLLLTPDIKVKYYARETYTKLTNMYYQSAFTKVLSNKLMGTYGNVRQFIPPVFFIFLITLFALALFNTKLLLPLVGIILSYNLIVISYSANYVLKQNERTQVIFHMFLAIMCMHASYAFGYLKGVFFFFILRKSEVTKNLAITR